MHNLDVSPARAGMDLFGSTVAKGLTVFPPHARGWTHSERCSVTLPIVSPARAGMDRSHSPPRPLPLGFPRTRGDGPHAMLVCGDQPKFPPSRAGTGPALGPSRPAVLSCFPRTRGDGPRLRRRRGRQDRRFPPYHARGWTQDGRLSQTVHACFPRTRGDGPSSRWAWRSQIGFLPARADLDGPGATQCQLSLPRVFHRNARSGSRADTLSPRAFPPSRAGMRHLRSFTSSALRRSLGVCAPARVGDGPLETDGLGRELQFPPHARAMDAVSALGPLRAGDVSRPHARGWTRFMPLAVLRTLSFPRTRGDGPREKDRLVSMDAFPPHARGCRPRSRDDRGAGVSVSPARAGMDPTRR